MAGPWSIGRIFAVIVLLNCFSLNHLNLDSTLLKDKRENVPITRHVWLESQLQRFYEPPLMAEPHLCVLLFF